MEGREEFEEAAPALLISYDEDSKHSLYNVLENRYYTSSSNAPMLQGKRVVGCCHGWLLLLENQTNSCCLWNPNPSPSNSEQETLIIHLPPLQRSHDYNAALLTKPPTEPDCHIIVASDSDHVGLAFCRIGDDAFNTQTLKDDDDEPSTLTAITSFKGRIYGLIRYRRALITLEFSGKGGGGVDIIPVFGFGYTLINSPLPWPSCPSYHLVPYSCEELWVVCKQNPTPKLLDSFEFWVFRVDLEKKECVKAASIGDRTLFISQRGNAFCCCSSANKTESNAIYYTRENGDCYVFHLDDGSTTSLPPPSPAPGLHHKAFWLQLQHPLLPNYFHAS